MIHSAAPAGVLVITAWVEGETPYQLRARVISTLDVTKGLDQRFNAHDCDEVVEHVRIWLIDFEDEHRKAHTGDAGVTPPPHRPATVEPLPIDGREEDGR